MDVGIKIIFFGGMIVLMYAVFSYWRIQGLIQESKILITDARSYTRHVSDTAPRVLFVGDSTGVGVGSSRAEDSVAGRFASAHPELNVENLSLSGKRTADVATDIEALPDTARYAYIVIQAGGNDIVRFSNTKKLRIDIERILKKAKRIGYRVYLLTSGNVGDAPMFPRPFAFLWEFRTYTVRDIFKETADAYGVTYVDLLIEGEDDPFSKDPSRYYAKDFFHLSGEGYGLWYAELEKHF